MLFNGKSPKVLLLLLFLMLPCLFHYGVFADKNVGSTDSVLPEEAAKLSKESAELLEQIKNGVVDHNKKLKSGKIEFTLTMSRGIKDKNTKKVGHEDVGIYHITYNFDGDRRFYDVNMRKKMEFNGTLLPDWEEHHYQYQFINKKTLMRERKGGAWIQHSQLTDDTDFRSQYNPHRWGWNPGVFSFTTTIKYYTPMKVEQVEVDGVPLYLITLHRVHNKKSSTTQLLWVDPLRGYRPVRSLRTKKTLAKSWLEAPDGTVKRLPDDVAVSHSNSIYQPERFAPGIWYPKRAIYESLYDPETQQSYRTITMQIHKAVFNIPIAEKDLSFSD